MLKEKKDKSIDIQPNIHELSYSSTVLSTDAISPPLASIHFQQRHSLDNVIWTQATIEKITQETKAKYLPLQLLRGRWCLNRVTARATWHWHRPQT